MNVDRRLPDGTRRKEETTNKSQIFITTAGWKSSYAYEKQMTILTEQILDPDSAVVLGGTWRIPVMEGLLNKSFVQELKLDGTYNESSFAREYESSWSGSLEEAFFPTEIFDRQRVLKQAENEKSIRNGKNTYYVIGVDVGRAGCTTEALVLRVFPQPQGVPLVALVNIFSMEAEHFEQQAINLKELYYKYQARVLAIDCNGLDQT